MSLLRLHGVGVAWAASAPIFDSLSLTLDGGFYGLVGANGSGKTTLLSLLAGERAPHEGSIVLSPRDAVVAYCRQNVEDRDADIDALAHCDDGVAVELRGRLALDPDELAPWPTLSPGERKRWQVAAAVAREPDVLLLDEPTNHLDIGARKRLLGALRRFTGLAVIVSHDRGVLDALTTATLRIHPRSVTLWPGRFSAAKVLWEHAQAEQLAAHAVARDRVRIAEAQLDAARRTQAAAAKGTKASARMKNRRDAALSMMPTAPSLSPGFLSRRYRSNRAHGARAPAEGRPDRGARSDPWREDLRELRTSPWPRALSPERGDAAAR
jgi:ATPase subunit of ABC transporter with duplicated ATPase domains